jgi:hypothetical protein
MKSLPFLLGRADRRDVARLHTALKTWLVRTEGKGTTDAARAAQEKLRSLGYIEESGNKHIWREFFPLPSDLHQVEEI